MAEQDTKTPEQNKVMQLYGVLGAALLLSLFPFAAAAILSFLLFIGLLISCYVIKKQSAGGSFVENHTIFIIRTLWIGAFYSLITMFIASLYLYGIVDNTPLDPCITDFLQQNPGSTAISHEDVLAVFRACYDDYMAVNFNAFMVSGAIAIVPIILYFSVRFIRGLSRALKNYRVSNPQSWF